MNTDNDEQGDDERVKLQGINLDIFKWGNLIKIIQVAHCDFRKPVFAQPKFEVHRKYLKVFIFYWSGTGALHFSLSHVQHQFVFILRSLACNVALLLFPIRMRIL